MRLMYTAGAILLLASVGVQAKVPEEFHGLWLLDLTEQCSAKTWQEMVALASGGYGIYIDDKNYVTTESECDFIGSLTESCCNTDTSKTISAGYKCGSVKNKVMLHIEVMDGKPVLIEATQNEASGPNMTLYFKHCPGGK